jgi:hypothetical protein
VAGDDLIRSHLPRASPQRSAFVKHIPIGLMPDRITDRTYHPMFQEHARALRYLTWLAAGLFPFGIIIESLKQGGGEPLPVYALLVLIGVLCHANCHAEWRADNGMARPPRGG